MTTVKPSFKIRLGLFITGGLAIFIMAIFLIGKQKNSFNPVFKLNTVFKNVSGLEIGCTVRFSGIAVGTVDNIKIMSDSTIRVDMIIKKNVQQFLRSDCQAAIGSSGIIGDRILVISNGSHDSSLIMDGQHINSMEPIETDQIIASLRVTADNAALISVQLAQIVAKINHGNGTLSQLIKDSTMAGSITRTITSLERSSRGLDENMNAIQDNFLLKGYFDKIKKEKQQKLDDSLAHKKATDSVH